MSDFDSVVDATADGSSGIAPSYANKDSDISCLTCRQKKVKCGREKPSCLRCVKGSKTCQYPDGPMKPGPKAGTGYRSGKRQRTDAEHEESANSSSTNFEAATNHRSSTSSTTTRVHDPMRLSNDDSAYGWHSSNKSTSSRPGDQYPPIGTVLSDRTKPSPAASDDALRFSSMHESNLAMNIPNPFKFGANDSKVNHKVGKDGMLLNPEQSFQLIHQTCEAVRTSFVDVQDMIELYFHNMTAFSLFHKPGFELKLQSIQEPALLRALLASMFTFSSHFRHNALGNTVSSFSGQPIPTSDEYYEMALKYTDEALRVCGDGSPPMEMLQAMILTTLHQCIRGWRGLAWRSVGALVRIALELELHQVDASKDDKGIDPDTDPETWCAEEEQRRAWWAIWELDVFVSTVRRLPTGIDITQADTFLPSDDEHWFNGIPQRSCFLAVEPSERWRALKANRVQSPRAWFIVVNSYMRSAQLLADPKGGSRGSETGLVESPAKNSESSWEDHSIIEDSIYCFSVELPLNMRYRGERLNFSNQAADVYRKKHECDVYTIHLMTQLVRFMLHRKRVFRRPEPMPNDMLGGRQNDRDSTSSIRSSSEAEEPGLASRWGQYLYATDEVLKLIRQTNPDHVKFVNPLVANIIWLTTSLLLVYQRLVFGEGSRSRRLVQSNIDVLKTTFSRFCEWWHMSPVLSQKLDQLEEGLVQFGEDNDDQSMAGSSTGSASKKHSVVGTTYGDGFPALEGGGDDPPKRSQIPSNFGFVSKPHQVLPLDAAAPPLQSQNAMDTAWPSETTFIPPPDPNFHGFFDPSSLGLNPELQEFLGDIFTTNGAL